jgi:HK97 family phage portal protein
MSLFAKRSMPAPLRNTGFLVGNNWSGESVTEETALEVAAVLSCVSLLADSVASLPLRAITQTGDRSVGVETPTFLTFPAATVTQYELIHMVVSSLALHGNAYLWLDYAGGTAGMPSQIVPLHPDNVNVTITGNDRTYTVAGQPIDINQILHLRWFTPPQAARGISPLHQQRNTIGSALAVERHVSQWYGEGGTPSSVLEVDGDISVEAAKVLQATWETQHRRRRRPAVLSGGVKWKPISASAADMELNASREYSVSEIARVFRIPAHMIGAKSASQTYTNNEQAGLNFLTFTLLPWLRRIESAFTNLMPPGQRVQFDTAAFLRADTINRYRAHQLGIASGFLTPNEVRAIEGLERFEGGDDFVMALPGSPMAGPGTEPPPVGVDADPPE